MRRGNQTTDRASVTSGIHRTADINPRTTMEAEMGMPMEAVMMMAVVMKTAGGRRAGRERGNSE